MGEFTMEGCVLPIQCTLIDCVTATKWKSHNYAKHLSSITPVILYHTLPYSTILYHALPYSTILYHTPPYSTILHHTLPYSTILYHTLPYSTILCHTLPYSDIRSSTAQLRTTLAGSIPEAPELGTSRYKGQNVGPQ